MLDRACTTNARYDAVQFVADGGLQSTNTFEDEESAETQKPVDWLRVTTNEERACRLFRVKSLHRLPGRYCMHVPPSDTNCGGWTCTEQRFGYGNVTVSAWRTRIFRFRIQEGAC